MTRDSQKTKEYEVSCFFLERLNNFYGLKYSPKINNDENGADQYVDIFGESEKEIGKLKLQLTICDGYLHQSFADARVEIFKTGEAVSSVRSHGGHILNPIKAVLEKKADKTTGEEILIIHNDYGAPLWDEDGAKRMLPNLGLNSKYKGIYLVIMPVPQPGSKATYSHEGQVIAIKNIFGEDGVCF